jgi:long-chain acyl-CoA synthetase
VRKGDRVATVLSNCRELLEVYWAVPSIGAVLVPLSPLLMPSGLASLLRDSGANCLITQRSMAPMLDQVRATSCPQLRADHVLMVDGPPAAITPDYTGAAQDLSGRRPRPSAPVGPDDLFNIMYTSGTTGLPKGIMHSHFVRSMYGTLFASAWRMTPGVGRPAHRRDRLQRRFRDPDAVLLSRRALRPAAPVRRRRGDRNHRPRARHAHHDGAGADHRPAQRAELLARAKLASLEMILSLGAPLYQEHKDQLNRLLPDRFYELYGLTEGFWTILDKTQSLRKSGSVGSPPCVLRDAHRP